MPPNINGHCSSTSNFNRSETYSPASSAVDSHSNPMINSDNEFDDNEVTRVAMRIAMSAFAKLESQSSEMSDFEIMRSYIQMCPYVSPSSQAVLAALKGLEGEHIAYSKNSPKSNSSDNLKKESSPRDNANTDKKNVSPRKLDFGTKDSSWKRRLTSILFCILGYFIRTLIFETPLALCFGAYLAATWTHRLHDLYLGPQIKDLEWDEDRMFEETTYYKRVCDASDQSAFRGEELFLPDDATTEEAYQHQLKHGMTVFPSILSDETATNLRDFIRSRNHNLSEAEAIYVIENDNRFSFGLGTEEPAVAKAMSELATHHRFKPALEKILGPKPALIEMTAITSTYGAIAQYWHDDVVSRASAMQFGRAFGPSYSIFVQLQNTTKEMGATEGCPGTHFCATGSMNKFCEKNGFQLVGKDGVWKAGDGMLMNMNVWHRGHAHVDPEGEDRVMLILTFVPRPRTHAESRQMSQGITFSLRWDMWGHTLYDLEDAKNRMSQPWATLRALGLYKPRDADWGIDFVTSGSHRIANEDNGFRLDELEEYIDEGGFHLLPKFLHPEMNEDDGWVEYYLKTTINCEIFFKKATKIAVSAYIGLQILTLIFSILFTRGSTTGPLRRFSWAMARLAITYGIIFGLYKLSLNHVDNTQWARDIVAGRRYTNPFILEEDLYHGPNVYPHREDVLIETRYKSASLAMYNDFIMAHPGNRHWKQLIENVAPLYAPYAGLPTLFQKQLSEYIVSSMESNQRRFLYQSGRTHWIEMSRNDAIAYNTLQLKIRSNQVLQYIYRELEFLMSELKTGHLREKVMTHYDMLPYLAELSQRFLDHLEEEKNDISVLYEVKEYENAPKPRPIKLYQESMKLTPPKSNAMFVRRLSNVNIGELPGEPEPGAWRNVGDIIEARWRGKSKEGPKWYWAKLLDMHSSGWHQVEFDDGRAEFVKPDAVRAYLQFSAGEKLEVWIDEDYEMAEVVGYNEDNMTLDLFTIEEEKTLRGVPLTHVRRWATKIKKRRKTQYY